MPLQRELRIARANTKRYNQFMSSHRVGLSTDSDGDVPCESLPAAGGVATRDALVSRRNVLSLVVIAGAQTFEPSGYALPAPKRFLLADDGRFPNSKLCALVYERALLAADLASAFEQRFERNGWSGSWRNGLFRTHHYHSTAHEVLGVYRGSVRARLGGPSGPVVTLSAGDVAILPAGVAHKNEGQSSDFAVVGAYPKGTSADVRYGTSTERPRADRNIAAVPLPPADPVLGRQGPLVSLWA